VQVFCSKQPEKGLEGAMKRLHIWAHFVTGHSAVLGTFRFLLEVLQLHWDNRTDHAVGLRALRFLLEVFPQIGHGGTLLVLHVQEHSKPLAVLNQHVGLRTLRFLLQDALEKGAAS
jgi:hypothetical protein